MLPKYDFDRNATYVIAGGLGGLGRSIARWMANRNAKNLILLSRSSVRSEAAQSLLDDLKAKGVNVAAPSCDVGDMQALSSTLAECSKTMPRIKGCIQASMVLKVRLWCFVKYRKRETDMILGWNFRELESGRVQRSRETQSGWVMASAYTFAKRDGFLCSAIIALRCGRASRPV